MHRISLSSGSLWGLGLGRTLDIAAAAGLDGVELVVDPEVISRGWRWLDSRARDAGVALTSVHPFLYALPPPLDRPSQPEALVRLAEACGVPVVTLHPPLTPDLATPPGQRWLAAMDRAGAMARRAGVSLSVENPPVFRDADQRKLLVRIADLAAFCSARSLAVTYDTAHAWSAGEDVLAALELVLPALVNVHLSDVHLPPPRLERAMLASFVKHHQLPGQGMLPLAELLAVLARSDYQGPITLELSPVALGWPRPALVRDHLAQAATWVRQHLVVAAD
jgi:sugar phosphate isomerase/epimerase